jgi:ribonuclease P protein component
MLGEWACCTPSESACGARRPEAGRRGPSRRRLRLHCHLASRGPLLGPVAWSSSPGLARRLASQARSSHGRDEQVEAHLSTKQAEACKNARIPGQDGHPGRSCCAQGTPAEGPAPPGRLTVGPRQTAPLSSRRAFEALRAHGSRGGSDLIKVRFHAAEQVDAPPKIAYAIPRRTAGAVGRNRIRRRLRAAVDLVAPELVSGDYLISPDVRCKDAAFPEVVHCLRSSLVSAGAIRKDLT